jgi:hypothetical protein
MNKTVRNSFIVIIIAILAVGAFVAGSTVARTNFSGLPNMMNYGWQPRGNTSRGPGMMGGYGPGNVNATPLTLDQARAAAESYLAALNIPDLEITEIMIFDNNAYVVVSEKSSGMGAFELLVDPVSQVVYPEHGPNMMWNLKYGGMNHGAMMGGRGMMGGYGPSTATPQEVSPEMTVTPEQAIQAAQAYLDANLSGATAADDPIPFYGYYTLDFERDGKVIGMLSVNGFTGQVFLHTWHGTFIEEQEY